MEDSIISPSLLDIKRLKDAVSLSFVAGTKTIRIFYCILKLFMLVDIPLTDSVELQIYDRQFSAINLLLANLATFISTVNE